MIIADTLDYGPTSDLVLVALFAASPGTARFFFLAHPWKKAAFWKTITVTTASLLPIGLLG